MPIIKAVMADNEHLGDFEVNKFPDVCPVCKTGNEFVPRYAYYKKDESFGYSQRLQAVFRCPRKACQTMFFAYYTNPYHRGDSNLFFDRFGFAESTEDVTFPEPIPTISKRFLRIYHQAQFADVNGLDEVRGPGYGKALEILLKDYLMYLDPERSEEIKKQKRLGNLIDQINDPNIQVVVERAVWLRNDETHYERVWQDEDIESLKDLIDLTVQHIKTAEMTKKYVKKMPNPTNDEVKPSTVTAI